MPLRPCSCWGAIAILSLWLSPLTVAAAAHGGTHYGSFHPHRRAILKKPAAMNNTIGLDGFNITAPHILDWMETDLPQVCSAAAPKQAKKVSAYSFWYSDCGSPFVACLADDSIMPLEEVALQIARIPVGLRRYISTLLVLRNNGTVQPGYESNWSVNGSNIVCEGFCDQSTFWHLSAESAYQQLSSSVASKWKGAVDADGCVATKIATQSYEQAFAEAATINIWHKAFGEYPPRGDCSCMQNQFTYMSSLPLFGASLLGDTCDISDGLGGVRTEAPTVTTGDTVLPGGYTTATPDGKPPSMTYSSLTGSPSQTTTMGPVQYAVDASQPAAGKSNSTAPHSEQQKDAAGSTQHASSSEKSSSKKSADPTHHSTSAAKSEASPAASPHQQKSQQASSTKSSGGADRIVLSWQTGALACVVYSMLAWVCSMSV